MYKIALCDDQRHSINHTLSLIEAYTTSTSILFETFIYLNPENLLADLEESYYFDFIFIDIEMPKLNGLDAIKKIQKYNNHGLIIVITSYTQYAINAIELEVFRYLVKSRMDVTFPLCLDAAIKRIQQHNKEHYFIMSARKHCKIDCYSILYCYKSGKMSYIVTNNDFFQERKPIHQLLDDLNKITPCYIMIERGYIVNLNHIRKLTKKDIILTNDIKLPVGVTYFESVKSALNHFWRNCLCSPDGSLK